MRTVRSLFAAPVRTQVVGEGRRGRGGGARNKQATKYGIITTGTVSSPSVTYCKWLSFFFSSASFSGWLPIPLEKERVGGGEVRLSHNGTGLRGGSLVLALMGRLHTPISTINDEVLPHLPLSFLLSRFF
jgi:hypothetical protein